MQSASEAPERDPYRFAPIFIISTARSYSSVVTAMIGQHPDLAGLPELKLFCCATIGDLESSLPQFWKDRGLVHRSPGLLRALAEYRFGGQTASAVESAREWLRGRPKWTGADVFDVLLAALQPRTPVEKSPDNLLSDDALARMAAAYPRARFVHLTRHPVTTQRSIDRHLEKTLGCRPPRTAPMSAIGAWYDIHRRIVNFSLELPASRYLRVRAEDILNDPEPRLRAIASWSGVRTDADAIEGMRHPECSPFARSGPEDSGATGGNDPVFLSDPVPHDVEVPPNLDPPEGWVADPPVWDMVTALARRLGY
jgi:hypothetical protein